MRWGVHHENKYIPLTWKILKGLEFPAQELATKTSQIITQQWGSKVVARNFYMKRLATVITIMQTVVNIDALQSSVVSLHVYYVEKWIKLELGGFPCIVCFMDLGKERLYSKELLQ